MYLKVPRCLCLLIKLSLSLYLSLARSAASATLTHTSRRVAHALLLGKLPVFMYLFYSKCTQQIPRPRLGSECELRARQRGAQERADLGVGGQLPRQQSLDIARRQLCHAAATSSGLALCPATPICLATPTCPASTPRPACSWTSRAIAVTVGSLQPSLPRVDVVPRSVSFRPLLRPKQQRHDIPAASPRCLVQSIFAVSVLARQARAPQDTSQQACSTRRRARARVRQKTARRQRQQKTGPAGRDRRHAGATSSQPAHTARVSATLQPGAAQHHAPSRALALRCAPPGRTRGAQRTFGRATGRASRIQRGARAPARGLPRRRGGGGWRGPRPQLRPLPRACQAAARTPARAPAEPRSAAACSRMCHVRLGRAHDGPGAPARAPGPRASTRRTARARNRARPASAASAAGCSRQARAGDTPESAPVSAARRACAAPPRRARAGAHQSTPWHGRRTPAAPRSTRTRRLARARLRPCCHAAA